MTLTAWSCKDSNTHTYIYTVGGHSRMTMGLFLRAGWIMSVCLCMLKKDQRWRRRIQRRAQ